MKNVESRLDFLKELPKNAIVAEIGVCAGVNAKNIIDICAPKQLSLVDPWKPMHGQMGASNLKNDELWEQYYENAIKLTIDYSFVTVHRLTSLEASYLYEDNFFDWVYIDAHHTYEACLLDLNIWFPKIKTGGLLCGHDYTDNENNRKNGFGVKRAVDEFLKTTKLDIVLLSNVIRARDFAIKKAF